MAYNKKNNLKRYSRKIKYRLAVAEKNGKNEQIKKCKYELEKIKVVL